MTRPGPGDPVLSSLFARRVLRVHGALTSDRASEVAASLLTLDALGDEHIDLHLQVPTGTWDAAAVLVDVIGVVGVPVHTTAFGVVGGGAVAVLTAGDRRIISPHARLHLRNPDAAAGGRPDQMAHAVADATARQAELHRYMAQRTGRPAEAIVEEWAKGGYLDAPSAIALGYADALAG